MPLFRREKKKAAAHVASAQIIHGEDVDVLHKNPRVDLGWQTAAWRYRDEIGEIRFALNSKANLARKVRLFAGRYDEMSGEVVPIEDPNDPAVQEVERFRGLDGTHGDFLHDIMNQWSIVGECYAVGEETDNGEEWSIFSVTELQYKDGKWWVLEGNPDRSDRFLDPLKTVVIRLWNPHPRFHMRADAAIRSVLDQCEDLQILDRNVRSTARSRHTQAGILFLDENMSTGPVDNVGDTGGEGAEDPFLMDVLKTLGTSLRNEGTANDLVPPVVFAPLESIRDGIKFIDFGRTIDAQAAATRKEKLERIGTGMEWPSQMITGLTDVNHWNGFLIDEQAVKSFLEPDLVQICNSLTKIWMRELRNIYGAVFWFDASECSIKYNQATDVEHAYDRGAATLNEYREALNLPAENAPTIADQLLAKAMRDGALAPEAVAEIISRASQTQVATTDDAPVAIPATSSETQNPSLSGSEPGLTAAAGMTKRQRDLRKMSERLAAIDRQLFTDLQSMIDNAMFRALERAGATVRRKVQKTEAAALIAKVSNDKVASTLGKPTIDAMNFATELITQQSFDGLDERYTRRVNQALRQTSQALSEAGIELNADELIERNEDNTNRGLALMLGAAAVVGADLLFRSESTGAPITPTFGEASSASLVDPVISRAVMAEAGGQRIDVASIYGPDIDLADVFGNPEISGVATGEIPTSTLGEMGIRPERFIWLYNPEIDRQTFEPHYDLDGVEFESWEDERLTNFGDWPDTAFYEPGDHAGCSCSYLTVFADESESERESSE